MLEYGVKAITTNPTLITKSNDIIRVVDSRSKQTRAFVLPSSFAPLVEKLAKELEAKEWAKEKKALLEARDRQKDEDELEDVMHSAMTSIDEYLGEF